MVTGLHACMANKQPVKKFGDIVQEKIASLVSEVNKLIENKDLELAIKRLDRGLAIQPRLPLLYKLRGIAYSKKEDYPSAIQNLKKAISLSSGESASELIELLTTQYKAYGELSYSQSDYQLALTNFTKASELDPNSKEHQLKCISCLFAMGNSKQCLDMVEHEIANDPLPSADLLLTRAKLYLLYGKVTECYHDVELVLYTNGDNPEAIELMKQLQTQSKTARISAINHSLLGKHKEAIRKYDITVNADPHNPINHIARGVAYRKLLSYSLAVDEFLLAMDKCSHQYHSDVYQHASRQLILTYNEFAMHCFRHGCHSDAVVLLNKAIKEEKNEYGLYLNRGDCFFKLGRYSFALADFQQAQIIKKERNVSLDYRLTVAHYTIGLKDFNDNKMKEAIDHFTEAIKYSSYTARLYTCRARAKYDLKDIDGAKEDTLLSLLLDTNCEDALPLVARLFPGNTPVQLLDTHKAKELKAHLTSHGTNETGVNSHPSSDGHSLLSIKKHIDDVLQLLSISNNPSSADTDTNSVSLTSTHDSDVSLTDHLMPRPWSVLKIDPPSWNEELKGSISCAEHNPFYMSACLTKKMIKSEIESILQANHKFPPRLKL